MPELPELAIYRERLEDALRGRPLTGIDLRNPFVLRTHDPAPASFEGKKLDRVLRAGKRLALVFEGRSALVFHLMRAGRLHLRDPNQFRPHAKRTLLALAFEGGPVIEMTEAGTQRRASLHAVNDVRELMHDNEGIDPESKEMNAKHLAAKLRTENRQIKSALRDSSVVTGIGNAYSDEILFAAKLSPLRLTQTLDDDEIERLAKACTRILSEWIERVRAACPEGLPTSQKDWRKDMLVHGHTKEPCPVCGTPIARISYKDNETNYCPRCQ
ncbi:MAG TPA: DNA-formamidopyrimidine glycosylase family protein, partial [bacterium]|nr:DNA-formamidopyrimidine glycosylase family protein [bacterium]